MNLLETLIVNCDERSKNSHTQDNSNQKKWKARREKELKIGKTLSQVRRRKKVIVKMGFVSRLTSHIIKLEGMKQRNQCNHSNSCWTSPLIHHPNDYQSQSDRDAIVDHE